MVNEKYEYQHCQDQNYQEIQAVANRIDGTLIVSTVYSKLIEVELQTRRRGNQDEKVNDIQVQQQQEECLVVIHPNTRC